MSVPDFQSLMLPLLRLAGDGAEHSMVQTREDLAANLNVSEEDQAIRLPSGKQTAWANRVAWAKVHLGHAGLLRSVGRGVFAITERGKEVLANPPERITSAYLGQFKEFVEFRSGKSEGPAIDMPEAITGETPQETLERAHAEINASLAAELVVRLKNGTPRFFEELVVKVLLKMGYGGFSPDAGEAVGRGGDEGIDGVINEDLLGLDVIYIQAKKWEGSVGRPEIQKFVGALHGKRARKGVFITTSSFSSEAQQYVEHIDPKVVLIGGRQLAEYMIQYGVGVSTVETYAIKHIDSDFFSEE